VVGNEEYSDPFWPSLENSESDAKHMAKKLGDLGFEVYDMCRNPKKTEIEAAVDWLVNRLQKSRKVVKDVVFYYSGHGCTHSNVSFIRINSCFGLLMCFMS